MPINRNMVIRVNDIPFVVKRVIKNIQNYDDEFKKKILQNTGSEYQVIDSHGNGIFCNKIPAYNFNEMSNKWEPEEPRKLDIENIILPKKRLSRTRRNKKKCRKY